jgi:hypothetical protein
MREHWSLVEVAIPLVLVLALGAIGVIPNRAALGVATALALVELAATGPTPRSTMVRAGREHSPRP